MKLLERNYKKYNFEDDYEVYLYGQKVFLFNLFANVFIVFVGILLNELLATFVWMLSFTLLRINLGGYHCQSPIKCFLTTNTVYISSMMIYKYGGQYFLFLCTILLFLFIMFFKYMHYIDKKAKIIMIVELFCLCIDSIQVIVVLTLIENIVSYLIEPKIINGCHGC